MCSTYIDGLGQQFQSVSNSVHLVLAEVADNLEHPVHAEDVHGYAALGPVSGSSCCHISSSCLSSAMGGTPPECGKCGL